MTIDGRPVGEVRIPATIAELGEAVATAPGGVAPVGAGTRLGFGNPLGPVGTAIRLERLNGITAYVPADMTIHFEAGVRLGQLRETLAGNNQMLPLDPWCGPEATLGGIVATNAQGPFRAVGTIRDWIIGLRVVHADGKPSRTGGRVVKNVTGYDLAKLYTGSLGSLGIIAEISLKLRARYEATASARLRLPDTASAAEVVESLRSGPTDPVSFLWSGPANEVRVRFGEQSSAVRWQIAHLPPGDWEVAGEAEADAGDRIWEEAQVLYDALPEPVVRVVVRPRHLGEFLMRRAPRAWLAHAGNGIVFMTADPGQIRDLRREFPVVLERASPEVRREVATFGLREPELGIMRRLKASLDPRFRLNPGRHVDGERSE